MVERPTHRYFNRRRAGLEAVEYALALGLIVSTTIITLAILGNWVGGTFALVISLISG